jgi:hypothetical protein
LLRVAAVEDMIVRLSCAFETRQHRHGSPAQRHREAARANVAAIHEELAKQYEALIEHAELRTTQAA